MENRKDKIVIISLIIFVFLFLLISGTINSGYHFVDDHEVIKIKNDLKTSSLISVSEKWVNEDLKSNGRFRPFYYIHRVIETKFFGSDFFLWSLYTGILWCMALIFFYSGMRKQKFAWEESIIFLIIVFIGPQCSVWWRLGPGESLGMVLLALSFYFMSKSIDKKNYHINNFLFIFFLVLSSLTKESFLIIIPAMVFLKIWNEKILIWTSLKESFYKNTILVIPLMIFAIELYIVRYHVGITYAGLETGFSNIMVSIISTSLHFLKTYLNLIIVASVMLIICGYIKKIPVKIKLLPLIFFLLVLIPNIILYSKSALVERYLLPSSLGLGVLVAYVIKGIEKDPVWFKKIVSLFVIISFLPYMVSSFNDALKFSKEGDFTKKILSAISDNYSTGSQVLVIVDPVEYYEKSVSLKTYLFYEDKIDLFGYAEVMNTNSSDYQGYVDGWKSYFIGRQFENLTSKPELLIFFDRNMIDTFFIGSKLSRDDYSPVEIGNSPFALFRETK
jgi:hypothetical protein